MAAKAKTKSASKRSKSTTAGRGKSAARKLTTTAKRATRGVTGKARRAKSSPVGKAAAKVLAGAAAGAVRAIIPQLEDAAETQEAAAGENTSGARAKSRKS